MLFISPFSWQPLWTTSFSVLFCGFEVTSVHAASSRATPYCFPLPLETRELKSLGWNGEKSHRQIPDHYLDPHQIAYFLPQLCDACLLGCKFILNPWQSCISKSFLALALALGGSVGWSIVPYTRRLQARFPVRALNQVVGSIPAAPGMYRR